MAKTNTGPEDLVEKCNALAFLFYKAHGYQVPKGYRFDKARHPQERGMWNLACIAFQFIEGTDVENDSTNEDEDE